ncbi:DUF4360 domain-containing protein [Umezawaea beigongshangensis]|uniref:DUF4360 domain-containing protein n=1 Tax=Umezawaea beigongshangensis TaxID=2780383 RepID=UPI0018F11AC0|nr:DUF4360 domain-containing protein [Umezawaea beigongshangensis]
MLSAMAAATILAFTAVSPAVAADADPPSGKIGVDIVTVNGSGCPAGTAAVAVAGDNSAFTVTYSNYLAKVGVDSSTTDFRKNCQLVLEVSVPQGFTYGVHQADYRGFASLQGGASGLQRASYYHQGQSPTAQNSHSFAGPFSDNWQATDRTESAQIVYAPCGERRMFNINTELRVYSGTSDPKTTTSFMTMDSSDGSVSTRYHVAWKTCP